MKDIYCVKEKRFTKNDGEVKYSTAKNGRKYAYVRCASCGIKKVMFV